MAVKCPKCHSENTDSALYCSNCATSLAAAERRLTKQILAFFLSSFLILEFGCHGGRPPDVELRTGSALSRQMLIKICDSRGFAESFDSIAETLGPFSVRQVSGCLTSRNWDGSWQEGIRPLFEIRAMGKGTKIYRAKADAQGRFAIRGLRDGQYCFMASCWGWDTYFGIVIVDKHADPKNEIFIEMDLASPR